MDESSNQADRAASTELQTDGNTRTRGSRPGKKRHRSTNPDTPTAKRVKKGHLKKYQSFFAAELQDAHTDEANLHDTQIGSSLWTAREKAVFFHSLARFGKDSLRNISAAIGTKSELEVRQYLLLLEQGLAELRFRADGNEQLSLAEFPAAVELSEACCNALDQFGEELLQHEEMKSAEQERKKHGDYWCLDDEIAERTERAVSNKTGPKSPSIDLSSYGEDIASAPGPKNEDILKHIPAARLLKLSKWIQLSERIFMNSHDPHWNWASGEENELGPGIYFSALKDFHFITVDLTRKVVQTAIFHCLSRIKALHGSTNEVTTGDIIAAVDTLQMARNSKLFWAQAPRRCGIVAFTTISDALRWQRPLSYDWIEWELGGQIGPEPPMEPPSEPDFVSEPEDMNQPERVVGNDGIWNSGFGQDIDTNSKNDDTGSEHSDGSHASGEPKLVSANELEQQRRIEDESAADRTDIEASQAEEMRIRELLRLCLPEMPRPESSSPPDVVLEDKGGTAAGIDWRQTVDFIPEWEKHGRILGDTLHRGIRKDKQAFKYSMAGDRESSKTGGKTPLNAHTRSSLDKLDRNMDDDDSATSTGETSGSAAGLTLPDNPGSGSDMFRGSKVSRPTARRSLPSRRAREQSKRTTTGMYSDAVMHTAVSDSDSESRS
ncbi:hypothetical protein BDY21DRAFT_347908 [Lineolata rhizophorae]|uniref:Myb-like domain-containing protein n=1 Tax=Lineolata rhizophorae TaxID=578093 RepID=A0A6A6NX71_9PEZI|nr:hypothetical protein BDY21DRAFT_347908 [Lineolata rhizophorae]